jgi:uncharacterized protein (TIGR03437 family)
LRELANMIRWGVFIFALAGCAAAEEFSTGQAARLVIGQKPLTAQEPGTTDRILGSVSGVAYANDTLIVADSSRMGGWPDNHRVLIYRNVSNFLPGLRDPIPQFDTRCPICVGAADTVLGQPDFTSNLPNQDRVEPAANTLRTPTGVAYNGRWLAVADTGNNRVLLWRSLPTANNTPADFVVGQPDFTRTAITAMGTCTPASLRGPQGVFLDANDGLWVADTGNSRVLFYGAITRNGQEARFALGQPDMNGDQQRLLSPKVDATTMFAPTSVSSDGSKVYVADLGLNRVLIWNAIPTRSAQPADVVLGQKEMTRSDPNDAARLCEPLLQDAAGRNIYPVRCAATLNFPRHVISDGRRLFIVDGGNDRILVYNEIPRENGVPANVVLGHQSEFINQTTESAAPERVSSSDSFRTPASAAWDGVNLYVTDTFNRRLMVYSPGDFSLPLTAVRNVASPEVFAQGYITLSGEVEPDQEITIGIGNEDVENEAGEVITTEYKYTTVGGDTLTRIIDRFVEKINAGDGNQWALASPNTAFNTLIFSARQGGLLGNRVTISASVLPQGSKLSTRVSGARLGGGQDAARIAPFTLVSILGENLADETVPAQDLSQPLPRELGGVQFYVDGIQCPMVAVAPDRVVAQMPVEVTGSQSASGILRVKRRDGSITVSSAVAIPLIAQNPGVFTETPLPPNPALAYHFSSSATGTVSVDGVARAGDTATIRIREREYRYTVQSADTLHSIRDGLVAMINANDPEVEAFSSGTFTRVRLRARVEGPAGNSIPISAISPEGASVIMTAMNSTMCCANEAGAPVTEENPAVPGSTIVVLATGLGTVGPAEARAAMINGRPYEGPAFNDVTEFVSSLAGGRTANVLFAGLRPGTVGIYEVHLELNPGLPTNPRTSVTIAQSFQVSNIFNIAVRNPAEALPSPP